MSHGALTVDHPVMPDDPPGRLPSYFLLLSYSIHVIKAKCSCIAHPGLMMLFFSWPIRSKSLQPGHQMLCLVSVFNACGLEWRCSAIKYRCAHVTLKEKHWGGACCNPLSQWFNNHVALLNTCSVNEQKAGCNTKRAATVTHTVGSLLGTPL